MCSGMSKAAPRVVVVSRGSSINSGDTAAGLEICLKGIRDCVSTQEFLYEYYFGFMSQRISTTVLAVSALLY